ncbi:MAG TPA: CsbD family protein [Solirubrobacteraceae bacterium]|nr:CsbD family protein [Solirubrobacteraceae bacterium]
MGILDKAKNAVQEHKGEAKETIGRQTNDPQMEAEGKKDQASGELKNAGEHVKDAAGNLKDAITH